MPESRKALRLVVLALILQLALAASIARAGEAASFFDHSLGDMRVELAGAVKDGKQGVLLMFEAEGCPFCRRMREQVLGQDEVQAYFRKHFAAFSIDTFGSIAVTDFAGRNFSEKDFARALGVRGTPTFLFVGADGREMARYVGATGDAREFLQLGRYVAEGHWRKMSFAEYFPASKTGRRKP
jgi:thioredoxin-related protein